MEDIKIKLSATLDIAFLFWSSLCHVEHVFTALSIYLPLWNIVYKSIYENNYK